MNEILSSIVAEVQAMRSGKFIPYHKMAAAVALIVTVIFSVIFSHSTVFEGRISVYRPEFLQNSVRYEIRAQPTFDPDSLPSVPRNLAQKS